jgi:hypothetical protein
MSIFPRCGRSGADVPLKLLGFFFVKGDDHRVPPRSSCDPVTRPASVAAVHMDGTSQASAAAGMAATIFGGALTAKIAQLRPIDPAPSLAGESEAVIKAKQTYPLIGECLES